MYASNDLQRRRLIMILASLLVFVSGCGNKPSISETLKDPRDAFPKTEVSGGTPFSDPLKNHEWDCFKNNSDKC